MRLDPLPPAAATVAAIVWGLFFEAGGNEFFARPISWNRSVRIEMENSKKMMEKPAWGRQERRDLPIWEKQIADDQFSLHTDCL